MISPNLQDGSRNNDLVFKRRLSYTEFNIADLERRKSM